MWKNLKIRTKMMTGFVLVLAVFAVSIAVTWSMMNGVSRENSQIITEIIPAQKLCSDLDEAVYELLLAMRAVQYVENDVTAAEMQKRKADVQKIMADVAAFDAANPGVVSTAYLMSNVVPVLKSYFDATDKSLQDISDKKAADNVLVVTGRAMSESVNTFVSKLWEYLENEDSGSDSALYGRHMVALRKANDLALRVLDARRMLLHFNDTRDLNGANGMVGVLDGLYSELVGFTGTLTAPENIALMEKMQGDILKYIEAAKSYVAAINELNTTTQRRNELRVIVNRETNKSLELSEERVLLRSESGLSELQFTINILCAAAGLAILLGFAVAVLISRSIARPLSVIVELANRAGGGDLTITKEDFHYDGRDELGSLTKAVSSMIDSQESAMKQVITVSGSLSNGAGSLSSIAEQTNASMEEVKASIEQVSALSESNGVALQECNSGVEEMSAGANTVARSAIDSASSISQTTEASNKAIQTVNRVIGGMRDVDANAKESENKIRQLVESVENVSSFVSVITGIADQTNLLALNAAIEAARAGDVGRGFAVVADEVRKLAEESARAAQNVNSIIVELQNGAQESIKATSEAGRRLVDTLEQAEKAQSELNQALKEMNKANGSIQNIAAVAQEQATSSKDVASAIDRATKSTLEMVSTLSGIRRATEETANAAQSVAEQSDSMSEHSSKLTTVLSHFKLSGKGGGKGGAAAKGGAAPSTPALRAARSS